MSSPKNHLKKSTAIILTALLMSAVAIWFFIFSKPKPVLRVWYFEVGQGDSEFIQSPENIQVLIDGGPSNKVLSELGQVMPFYDHSIDYVIITHPDADHITGLLDVVKRYEISIVIYTGVEHETEVYQELLKEIDSKGISKKIGIAGQTFHIGDNCNINIIYPLNSFEGKRVENLNNTSLVSKLDCEGKKFIFTGDAEVDAQKQIVSQNEEISADVLKVSHHGAKNATLKEFLDKVKPQIAVISVGAKNRYGHPTPEVLAMLAKFKIYRTDQDGTILIKVDKGSMKILKNQGL